MQGLSIAAAVLLGYLAGSIPFGYLLVKALRGVDIRDYGSHNIGVANVQRVAGRVPAALCLLLDASKGLLPVIVAHWLTHNAWAVVLAGAAACVGHAYSLVFLIKERKFSRGKAVATGLGALVGLAIIGAILSWVLLSIIGVWAVFLGVFRYMSLASLAGAAAFALAVYLTPVESPYRLFAILLLMFIIWKHKENIGRLIDGTEVRLSERVPLANYDDEEVACAFVIHPFSPADWWQSRLLSWLRGKVPIPYIRSLMRYVRPMKNDVITGITTRDGRKARVYLIGVPLLADQIKANEPLAVKRAIQAAHLAHELGASVVGLGAFMSVVGEKGAAVQRHSPIPVTNGGSLTAGSIRLGLSAITDKVANRLESSTVAVVGANGVVGFKICRDLAPQLRNLIMIGTNLERLENGGRLLQRLNPNMKIQPAVCCDPLPEADIIFTATSDPNAVIFSHHLKQGALVFDLGRPADVDPSVLVDRPDIKVIPGGTIRMPGNNIKHRVDLGFGRGNIPACMAETIIIALEKAYERVTLGDNTSADNVEFFVQKAEELGFEVVAEPYASPKA